MLCGEAGIMGKRKKASNNISPTSMIKNPQRPGKNIRNPYNPEFAGAGSGFAFDVSFPGLYYSVECGNFNNFLKDENQFIEKFKDIRRFLDKTNAKDFQKELLGDTGMKHCHPVRDDKYNLAIECIKSSLVKHGNDNAEQMIDQMLEGEKLYQIGFEGGSRYIGTYDSERRVFRLYLIDYHHKLYPKQRYNQYSTRDLKYCIMTSK